MEFNVQLICNGKETKCDCDEKLKSQLKLLWYKWNNHILKQEKICKKFRIFLADIKSPSTVS
jgi:hypothetical protein